MRSQLMTVSTTLALAVVVTATPRVVSAAGCPWDIVDANRGEKTDPWESAWMSPCWSTAPPPSEELRPPDPPPSDLPPLAPLASDPLSPGSTLRSGESLLVDQVRRSADGRYTLVYQGDGNLVLLDGSTPVWATGTQDTTPGVAAMQGDGNFVIYNHQGQAVCASGTVGEAGAFLEVQTDGNVVLYRADGVQLRDRHTAVPSLCDPLSSPPSLPAPSPPPLPPPPNEPPSTGEEEVIYFHTDAIGSVRLITDAAGAVVSRHDFQAFGPDMDNADQPNDPSIRLQFAGKERDVETGAHGWTALDYFGARYYASRTGRFTTVDPVVDIEAAVVDPQRWNRYSYALNGPYRYVDPDGANPILLLKLAELAQRAASSPAAQRAQQVIVNQGARAWVALTRLFNTPAGQEALETATELVTGGNLGPTTGAARSGIGAVIGHFDAGYAKVGRDLRVAVFDIPKEIWDRLTTEQKIAANRAFLEGVVERRLAVKVVTEGPVRIPSILAWEIDYLLGKGYRWNEVGDALLPPD